MQNQWLLFSDLAPMVFFSACTHTHPIPATAMLISRVCSLMFHVLHENRPYMINLDYMGISAMALVSYAHLDDKTYHFFLNITLGISLAIFIHGILSKSVSPYSQHAILALAFVGNLPSLARIHLLPSTILFSFGFFVIEPLNHTAWHWLASLGQAFLLNSI